MKKIMAFVLVAILAISLCGCATQSSSQSPQTVTDPATTDEIVYTNYDDSIRGVCEYMADLGYVYDLPEATSDEMTEPYPMRADLIGADEGYKFSCSYDGSTVTVEIYSFSDFSGDLYKQAVSEGKMTLSEEVDNGTFNVYISGNGKYVMMYDDSADREEREAEAIAAFAAFYA